jgi:hypothetical protein
VEWSSVYSTRRRREAARSKASTGQSWPGVASAFRSETGILLVVALGTEVEGFAAPEEVGEPAELEVVAAVEVAA